MAAEQRGREPLGYRTDRQGQVTDDKGRIVEKVLPPRYRSDIGVSYQTVLYVGGGLRISIVDPTARGSKRKTYKKSF